jgi:hypothetical protein
MAKKSTRKVAVRKTSKSATATKGRQVAKKAKAKKPARPGGSHVSFGLHGLTTIMKTVHEAGLERELDKELKRDDKFVRVSRDSLRTIKEFVASRPELAQLHNQIQGCDCPPDDHYCIYI